jgi:hypothetical protein
MPEGDLGASKTYTKKKKTILTSNQKLYTDPNRLPFKESGTFKVPG